MAALDPPSPLPPQGPPPPRTRHLVREQAERIVRAVAEAPFPIFIYAEDGEILHLSRAVTELTGYTAAELPTIGAWAERAYGKDAEHILEQIARRFEIEGRVDSGEFTIHTREGGRRVWVFSSASLGRDRAGRRLLISVAADLTERKCAEQALRESEERLRLAQQAAQVGTWDLDLATGEVAWSEGIFELAGLPPEEGVPPREVWRALLHEEDRERVDRQIDAAIEGGGIYENEFRIVRPDGELRWLAARGRVTRDEAGRPARFLAVNFDITERKRAEAERAARTRQQAAVADLGLFALREPHLQALLDRACAVVADILGVEHATVLELRPGGEAFRLRAAVGFPHAEVGRTSIPNEPSTQAGYTLLARGPVHIEELANEARFRPTALLTEHGVTSGLSVAIGPHERPFGILGAHTAERRRFAEADEAFLQAIAHVLWAAAERSEAQRRLEATNAALEEAVEELQAANAAHESRAEERTATLRRHETLLASVLSASLDGIIALDAVRDGRGRIVDLAWRLVNPAAAEVARRHVGELVGRRFHEVMRSPTSRRLFGEAVRVIETRVPFRQEIRYDGDGLHGWFDFTMVPLADGVAVTVRDITRQKEAAEALRQSERRFRELFEASPDAIFVESLEGIVLDANPAACRLHRAEKSWLLGRNVLELVPEQHHAEVEHDFGRLVAGEIGVIESYSLTAEGEAVPIEVRADRVTYDGREALLLHVRDITERRRAEQALRESEERFSKAFRAAPVALCITEPEEGRLVDVNEAYCQLTGYPAEELIGQSTLSLGLWESPQARGEMRTRFERAGTLHSGEFRLRTKSGALRDVLSSMERIELAGTPYILAIALDVTERKRLERDVIEAAEAERRRIGQDLHDDLGQRLTGAAFLSQVLQQKLERAGRAEAAEVEHLTRLLTQTLTETRSLSRVLSPVDIQAEGLADALQELAEQTEQVFGFPCRLALHGDERLADNAAATHLYRIAQEAVNNAVKHAEAQAITLSLTRREGRLTLRVEDDGRGIPEEALAEASGLGLRTMRYRADLIGASLLVRRREGGGTLVACTLG